MPKLAIVRAAVDLNGPTSPNLRINRIHAIKISPTQENGTFKAG